MRIEGVVTAVNEKLLCFVIDKTVVHMVFVFISNPEQKLPSNGAEITVESEVFRSTEFEIKTLSLYPGHGCTFNGCFTTVAKDTKFAYLVNKLELCPTDLLQIDRNYQNLKTLTSLYLVTVEDLLFATLEKLAKNHNFTLKLISQMGFVGQSSDNYKNLSYWTFGNHWNVKQRGRKYYLLGYLFVHKKYGTLCFTDFTRIISCTITHMDKENILNVIFNYVLIENYAIMTEIYNSEKFASLEYLVVDLKDIVILPFECEFNHKFILDSVPENFHYSNSLEFKITSKSVPSLNSKGQLECWLFITVETNQMLLCLNSAYTEVYPLLREDCTYKVYFQGSLKTVFNKEMKVANAEATQYELPPNAVFILAATATDRLSKFNSISQASQLLSSSTNLVTFQGKISLKKFLDPLSSRTGKVTSDLNFGTPGTKTHLLEFEEEGAAVTVYLNNWENMSIPYCLIPNMRLIVHNVLPQKQKYYKSTAMTSFEVVAYEPDIHFETVNLRTSGDWGIPYCFGARAIPNGVMLWNRPPTFFILGLKIFHKCTICDRKVQLKRECQSCKETTQKLTATVTLIVRDQMGESKVIAKDDVGILLLQLLLRAQKPVFDKLYRSLMDSVDSYEYFKRKTPALDSNFQDHTVELRIQLTKHFHLINELGMSLDLKVKKIANESSGKCLYYLLDVRKT